MGNGDRLILTGMQFFGHHGDVEAERILGGRLEVDVELSADLGVSGKSDQLKDTIDYARCFGLIQEVVENRQYNLIEAVAENIASALLEQERAEAVLVRVAKQPPLRGLMGNCAVVIHRSRGERLG